MSIQFHNKLRFHILGIPHTITGPDWSVCPFTTKVWKFAKMMKQKGHIILHYGHENAIVDCDEHVTLITNKDFDTAYGDYNWRENGLYHYQSNNDFCHNKFNELAIPEIKQRLQKGDFVLCFWGKGHEKIGKFFENDDDAIVVEPGVGYSLDQSFTHFKIFESYAYMHMYNGVNNNYNPSWYNAVIPLSCDIKQFDYCSDKDDYFLHLGRIDKCKGLDILIKACNYLNVKLRVAGTPKNALYELGVDITSNIEYVGCVGIEERRNLLSKARGLVQLSTYIEPFGCAVIEAMLSGCPVITSDWGGFTETVLHGYTGYRVRNYDQLIWAMKNISNIDGNICRSWVENNYSIETVLPMYEEYFYNLKKNLSSDDGWWYVNENRTTIDWLKKDYSMINNNITTTNNSITYKDEPVKSETKITLVITTCKRYNQFNQLITSLFDNCVDMNIINEVIIIDDNSNILDKKNMLQIINTKFNQSTYKRLLETNIKGQYNSISFLLKDIVTRNDVVMLLEDDWIFRKSFNLYNIVKYMEMNDEIIQIQLTDLYNNLKYYNYKSTDLLYYRVNITSPELPKKYMYYLKNKEMLLNLTKLCENESYGYINNISNDYWWPGFKFDPCIINHKKLSNIYKNCEFNINSITNSEIHFASILALKKSVVLHKPIGLINDNTAISAFVLNDISREYEYSNPTIVTTIISDKDIQYLTSLIKLNNPIVVYAEAKYKLNILSLKHYNSRIIYKEINNDSLKHFKYYNEYEMNDIYLIYLNFYWLYLELQNNTFKSKEIYWVRLSAVSDYNIIDYGDDKIHVSTEPLIDSTKKYISTYGKCYFDVWFNNNLLGGNIEVLMELLIEYFRYTNTMKDEEGISYDKILNVLCNKYSSKIKVI